MKETAIKDIMKYEIDEVEEVVESEVEVEEEVEDVEEVVEEPADETLVGKVSGTDKLYVRKKPGTIYPPLCVVAKDDVLLIDAEGSTAEWYKVYTETGVEGFCMKKYVTVN